MSGVCGIRYTIIISISIKWLVAQSCHPWEDFRKSEGNCILLTWQQNLMCSSRYNTCLSDIMVKRYNADLTKTESIYSVFYTICSLAGHTKNTYGDFSQLFVSSSGMLELLIRLQRTYTVCLPQKINIKKD